MFLLKLISKNLVMRASVFNIFWIRHGLKSIYPLDLVLDQYQIYYQNEEVVADLMPRGKNYDYMIRVQD